MIHLLRRKRPYVVWFKDLTIKDIPLVGGKNASLGEMYAKLTKKGVDIPNGFAITAEGYRHFLRSNGLEEKIKEALQGLDTKEIKNLQEIGKKIRDLVDSANLPEDLEVETADSYARLSRSYHSDNTDVAVRSSATAEDLPDASFAGQQATFLNVRGRQEIARAVVDCFASLFTDRAISYRVDKGFDHLGTYLSVGIQKMVRSDKACSGVMFTLDPDTGFENVVVINSTWGLGELIVQGEIIPDEYQVFKPTLKQGFRSIITKNIGTKLKTMVYSSEGDRTEVIDTPEVQQNRLTLSDSEVLQLAQWAMAIEEHYGKPMDIEWAKDGLTDQLFVVQARPETIHGTRKTAVIQDYRLTKKGRLLLTGTAVGTKIGRGRANIIQSAKQISRFKQGEVLVTRITDPDWEPIMKIAAAIVTDEGGRTSHAAIVSRELGIPCVVGTEDATKKIKPGDQITVDCSDGTQGRVWSGQVEFTVKSYQLQNLKQPKTQIMVNIGSPNEAFKSSFLPCDGVGLAREEFIIASQIKIHPLALLNYQQITDPKIREEIDRQTAGYPDKADFYVRKLASGIAQIGSAFYPKPVIVRFSDFKTNEYAQLVGGNLFEPKEENPMIGWRGASRYYDPRFQAAFGLECAAIRHVREGWGLTNVIVMVPFCRTVEEGKKVLSVMAKYGLKQGQNGLKVYMMAEIPSNIILAEKFLGVFDGFSIGSNDLSQLTLGIDRDNSTLGAIGDENNDAVKDLVEHVVKLARKRKRYIGICGQAPSDYPEFAKFLVGLGITSISLNPDTVVKTTLEILKQEAS